MEEGERDGERDTEKLRERVSVCVRVCVRVCKSETRERRLCVETKSFVSVKGFGMYCSSSREGERKRRRVKMGNNTNIGLKQSQQQRQCVPMSLQDALLSLSLSVCLLILSHCPFSSQNMWATMCACVFVCVSAWMLRVCEKERENEKKQMMETR